MKSYRTQLGKITAHGTVSYREFFERPRTLSAAMRFMDNPGSFTMKIEKSIKNDWTEQCQGVAWDGSHWLFSSNGSQPAGGPLPAIGGSPKAIYTFDPHTNYSDDQIKSTFVVAKVTPFDAASDFQLQIPGPIGYGYHVGAIFTYQGRVYVDHFTADGVSATLALNNNAGALSFSHWIVLDPVNGQRVGLVAINPFDSTFLTAFGDGNILQIFVHGMDGKRIADRTLTLSPPIADGRWVQGGAVTENGHLYIASGKTNTGDRQYIYCYSLLNGHLLQTIPVVTEGGGQELEGVCYVPYIRDGLHVQLHAVLLEGNLTSKDNIFFKSFASDQPASV